MSDEVRKATVKEQARDALRIGTVFELECALRRALVELPGEGKVSNQGPCCVVGCEKEAEWMIEIHPYKQDDFTTACTGHVGELLTDAPEHIVHRPE